MSRIPLSFLSQLALHPQVLEAHPELLPIYLREIEEGELPLLLPALHCDVALSQQPFGLGPLELREMALLPNLFFASSNYAAVLMAVPVGQRVTDCALF